MKKLIPILLAAAMLLVLAGCGGGDVLKGTWVDPIDEEGEVEKTWIFDGKGGAKFQVPEWGTNSKGTYTIDGDKVTIKLPAWDAEKIYVFQVDGQKLTLTATDEYSPSYEMTKQ